MKYNKNGEYYSCNGYYKNDSLIRVICFSPNKDTILKEAYSNGQIHGKFNEYYPSGQMKADGSYSNGWKSQIWKEYYDNGELKTYRFYNPELDSFNLYYEKVYDNGGKLYSLRYPIRMKTNLEEGDIYKVGESYQLFVTLAYSEFDSINSAGIFKESTLSSVFADTVLFEGNILYCEFSPQKPGIHTISGTYIELDASKENTEDGYGGEKEFNFQYEAK